MVETMMNRISATLLTLGLLFSVSGSADAQWIGRQAGAHDNSIEYEFHATLGYDRSYDVGVGFRLGIPLLKNGFISSINNNVAISVGADFVH